MRLILRADVEVEIEAGFSHYLKEAGGKVAGVFLDEIDAVFSHLQAFPETGSPRYRHLFPEIDLRFWLVKRFPYVVFYVVRDEFVDVIALLHQHADIGSILLDRETDMEAA